jgi:hypothetical protein
MDEIFVYVKSVYVTVRQLMASFPVRVNAMAVFEEVALSAANVRIGAVTSAIVTTTDEGEPFEMVVRAFPYRSSTLNELEDRIVLVPDEPGDTDDVAVMVHFNAVD